MYKIDRRGGGDKSKIRSLGRTQYLSPLRCLTQNSHNLSVNKLITERLSCDTSRFLLCAMPQTAKKCADAAKNLLRRVYYHYLTFTQK